jgi:hypothetical protein
MLKPYEITLTVGRKSYTWTRYAENEAILRESLARACADEFPTRTVTIQSVQAAR